MKQNGFVVGLVQLAAPCLGMLLVTSASAAVHYVDVNNTAPSPPYLTWASAATNIQDAVDVAVENDEIVVTNGVYRTGGWTLPLPWGRTDRVTVTNRLTLRSANGPDVTVIDGRGVVRCVYLGNGARLSGFTLTNGVARGPWRPIGGGVCCESIASVVSNCVITGCSATGEGTEMPAFGGGAYAGTLENCVLIGNSASGYCDGHGHLYWCNANGGGASGSVLNNCLLVGNSAFVGGGASECALTNCTLDGNSVDSVMGRGGGAWASTLNNCTLSHNVAGSGGGAFWGTMADCLLTGNSADSGGGTFAGTLTNCLLTGNSARIGAGAAESWLSACTLTENNGSGALGGRLENCVIARNSGDGTWGGRLVNCTVTGNSTGVCDRIIYDIGESNFYGVRLTNCIVYGNTVNHDCPYGGVLNYCCTTPLPTAGVGNFVNPPLFVDPVGGNLRLQSNSPCINAGNNEAVTAFTDLDGNARISGGTVDVGAYEFVFTPGMEVGRLVQLVSESDMGSRNKQPLLATLAAAMASFSRGDASSGANQLGAFQNKVRAQLARTDAVLANELIQAAEEIIAGQRDQ